MNITSKVFQSYVNCKYKAYLQLNGKNGERTDFEIFQDDLDKTFEIKAERAILASYTEAETLQTASIVLSDLQKGKKVALNAHLDYSDLSTCFNALIKVPGKSALGPFHYEPTLFFETSNITKAHRLHLGFQAFIIGSVQKRMPQYCKIIHGPALHRNKAKIEPYIHQAQRIIQEIREQQSGKASAGIVLNSHCAICEF